MTSVVADEAAASDDEAYRLSSARVSQHWCIITPAYPPMTGGISDHTFLLARALADAGDTVDVWCPPAPDAELEAPPAVPGVTVHPLSSRFGLGALGTLRRTLREQPRETRVLVQWMPTGFGLGTMNLPFALVLFSLRGRPLDLYVHEVGWEISSRETMRRALAGVAHRAMTWMAARSARRVYVSTPEWGRRLDVRRGAALEPDQIAQWVPVSSNVPDRADAARVAEIRDGLLGKARLRTVVGHFGSFDRYHAALMPHVVTRVLDEGGDRVMLLIGRGSAAVRDTIVLGRPDLAPRLAATGGVAPSEVSAHLAACDVLVQPFEDGASARRGSLMAGLALGLPTITNRGPSTEDVWSAERAVHLTDSAAPHSLGGAVTKLMADPQQRARLGAAAGALYAARFALARGVTLLRELEQG